MTLVTTKTPLSQQRLDSWKSISSYLGRACRTVQRWYSEYGLPIHRLGGSKSSVFAYADELDDWMRNWGRVGPIEPPEILRPAILQIPFALRELDQRRETLNFSLIPIQAKRRSTELVALAYRMWETLSNSNLNVIVRYFREAIDLNPGNASAFAGLSHALIAESLWGFPNAPASYASAQAASEKALEIDAELHEARGAAAWLNLVQKRDWRGAREGFDEVMKYRPHCSRSMMGEAMLNIAGGNVMKASSLLLIAAQQDPLSSDAMGLYCWSLYLAGEYANSLRHIEHFRASGQSSSVADAVEALASIHLDEPVSNLDNLVLKDFASGNVWSAPFLQAQVCF
jgi:hypothetical protein